MMGDDRIDENGFIHRIVAAITQKGGALIHWHVYRQDGVLVESRIVWDNDDPSGGSPASAREERRMAA